MAQPKSSSPPPTVQSNPATEAASGAKNEVSQAKNVLDTVLAVVQGAVNITDLWEKVPENFKDIIKSVFDEIFTNFRSDLEGRSPDEQIVQAGKIISVIRVLRDVLCEEKLPVLKTILHEDEFKGAIVRRVFDALSLTTEEQRESIRSEIQAWHLHTDLSEKPGVRLPKKGL